MRDPDEAAGRNGEAPESEATPASRSSRLLGSWPWPWLILGLLAAVAVWHVLDFEDGRDREFPRVPRLGFSSRPAAAYRLAEPGDTLDRIAIYASAAGLVLSLAGLALARGDRRLWRAAAGLSLAAIWHAATPGPTFDGWHGLGWRTMFDPSAPWPTRLALALAAAGLGGFLLAALWPQRRHAIDLIRVARARGMAGLLAIGAVLVALRQVEFPGIEPVGYWPRCAFAFGLVAFDLALVRALPSPGRLALPRRLALAGLGAGLWFALVAGGIGLTWYHRPLERLRTVVPGRIYISAMPTARGLAIAHGRHHFRTIINLFPEDTPLRSPRLPEELDFARTHGIHYVGSPSDEESSNQFLDQTLALAQDPSAWPILVHCHGCMDRTPAWMGIYRFLVEDRPLAEVLREIERHRGCLPKASVTLLYNRVLPPRAPGRYDRDPTAALLRQCARGAAEPKSWKKPQAAPGANSSGEARVSGRAGVSVR